MRNIIVTFPFPKFATLEITQRMYRIKISLQITKEVATCLKEHMHTAQNDAFSIKCISAKGTLHYYLHCENSYTYEGNFPFANATERAYENLKHLKIMAREGKIWALQQEIETIKYCE